MIEKIYLDNYKCFTNFECRFQALNLILGENGTGKTVVLDVLETLREVIVAGLPTKWAFPAHTLTAWDRRAEQAFDVELTGNGGRYSYRIVVEHMREPWSNRIAKEHLQFDGRMLYEFDGTNVHLMRDDESKSSVFPFDCSRSAIATIPEHPDYERLTWFRRRMERVYVFSPDPRGMVSASEKERAMPDRPLHHLASWLRHLSQESVDMSVDLRNSLRNGVLDGFVTFGLKNVGETSRLLEFDFSFSKDAEGSAGESFTLPLAGLSAGQRCLVVLYCTLHAAVAHDWTICIDEPDNFLALREIQPWLVQLADRVVDGDSQCLLISHHPELLNYLAAENGLHFFREETGPIRCKRFAWDGDELLPPADVVARGWE